MILSLLFFIHSITASFHAGGVMPDGKVDKVVNGGVPTNRWHAPVYGGDVSISFAPDWRALREWNNARVGVGLGYWYMGHEKLGHAITPYIYMAQEFKKDSCCCSSGNVPAFGWLSPLYAAIPDFS